MNNLINILILIAFLSCLSSCSSTPDNEQSPEEQRAELLYGQGTEDLINKDYTSALKNLLEAKELSPENPKILNNLGMAYYFKKRVDEAVKLINQSIKINNNSDARNNLASIYFEQKKFDLAEKEYLAIRNDLTYPHQYRTYYALGLIQLSLGNKTKAKQYFDDAVMENDTYCPAHFKLGELEFKEENFERALDEFKNASRGLCINDPAPRYHEALTLLKMKKIYQAKKTFEEIKEKFPETHYYAKLADEQIAKINNPQKEDPFPKEDKEDNTKKNNDFSTPLF